MGYWPTGTSPPPSRPFSFPVFLHTFDFITLLSVIVGALPNAIQGISVRPYRPTLLPLCLHTSYLETIFILWTAACYRLWYWLGFYRTLQQQLLVSHSHSLLGRCGYHVASSMTNLHTIQVGQAAAKAFDINIQSISEDCSVGMDVARQL